MFLWIVMSAKPVNRSSPVLLRRYDFNLLKLENDLSTDAVVTGNVLKINKRLNTFGKISLSHSDNASREYLGTLS